MGNVQVVAEDEPTAAAAAAVAATAVVDPPYRAPVAIRLTLCGPCRQMDPVGTL